MTDSEHGIVPAQDDWTTNIEWPGIDLTYREDLDFAGAVAKAKAAKSLKAAMVKGVLKGMGRYIAELSTLASVKYGGIAKFAKAIGMNYVTLKTHRSRYLDSGQKRRYVKKVTPVTIPEAIEQPVEEAEVVDDKPLEFTDMFDGSKRTATELEVVEPAESAASRAERKKTAAKRVIQGMRPRGLAHGVTVVTIRWEDGDAWSWYPADES